MPSNADSQILPLILKEVQEARKDTARYLERQAKTEQSLHDHKQDTSIHQQSPCETVKSLDRKIWAALVTALLALGGLVWRMFSAKLLP